MKQFDVIVVGGGLVGACQALSLSRRCPTLSVAVIEPFPADSDVQPSFDDRAIAIAKGSIELLKKMDTWQSIESFSERVKQVTVSDQGHFGKTRIVSEEMGVAELGCVTEVRLMGQALYSLLQSQSNIELFCPDKILQCQFSQQQVTVSLESSQQLSGQLLLVADGSQSHTRQQLGIELIEEPYTQMAVITNVEVADGHRNNAFERFTANGPAALLPMTANRYSLAWCLPEQRAREVVEMDQAQFISELHKVFAHRAGTFVKAGKTRCYPLSLARAERLTQHRVALIGNASHTIHPIAGQGFNLGLRDVEAMSQLIADAQQNGEDVGGYGLLREYEQRRQPDMERVMTLTDFLVRTFSNHSRFIALFRSLGLTATDQFNWLKKPLAQQLMGQGTVSNKHRSGN